MIQESIDSLCQHFYEAGIDVIISNKIKKPIGIAYGEDYAEKIIGTNRKDKTSNQIAEELIHEEVHLSDPFELMYALDASPYEKRLKEEKVELMMMKRQLPMKWLSEMIKNEVELEDIADQATVTPEFVMKTLEHYNDLEEWHKLF